MKNKFFLLICASIFIFISFIFSSKVSKNFAHQDIDSTAYLLNAAAFYENNSFFSAQNQRDIPYYSLGYAFFIGLIYKIFGVNDPIVIWIQILLALLTGFLIFRITNLLFGKKSGLFAAAFFCINIGYLTFAQFLLTEILLSFFLVLFFERFIWFLHEKRSTNLFLAALFLGISITVKPAAIYFVLFIVLYLLFFINKKLVYRFKAILLFCLAFYIPILGYMFFNKMTFGTFSVAALGNENLYFYLLPKVLASQNGTSVVQETQNVRYLIVGSKLDADSWIEVKELFLMTLKNNPFIFVKIWMTNVLKTFLGLFTTNLKILLEPGVRGGDISFFKVEGNFLQKIWNYISAGTDSVFIKFIGLFEAIFSILRYFLCAFAFYFLFSKKRYNLLFLFLFFIFYFSMITGHDGCARFRMMFEFVLIILSAQGFYLLISMPLCRSIWGSNIKQKG